MSILQSMKNEFADGGTLTANGVMPVQAPVAADRLALYVISDLVDFLVDEEAVTLDASLIGGHAKLLKFLNSRYGERHLWAGALARGASEGR